MDTSPSTSTSTSPAVALAAAVTATKRANDTDHEQREQHDHTEADAPPTISLIARLAPAFLDPASASVTDPSVDPATLAIPQWSGPCTLALSPSVPHLPVDGGTLTVANTRLYWWHAERQLGFALDYRAMVMHAVQSGQAGKSVYCQLAVDVRREIGRAVAAAVVGAEAALAIHVQPEEDYAQAADDNEDEEGFSELTISPVDDSQVDDLFSAMSICASMHPDPMNEGGEDGDDDMDVDMMMAMMSGNHDQAAIMAFSEQGQANLARFDAMLDATANNVASANGDGQFDDAQEESTPPRR